MTLHRGVRSGLGAALPLALVAGLALAAATGFAADEARADHHHLELVSVTTDGGKTADCVGISTADGSTCLDGSKGAQTASTTLDVHENETKAVKKSSCARTKR